MSEGRQMKVDDNRVIITTERSLYPLDVVYGAAYVFIDRCFVLLDAPDPDHVQVELRGRQKLDATGLEDLAGEFGNELLTQAWRQQVTKQNMAIIEAVAAQGLFGAAGSGPDSGPDSRPDSGADLLNNDPDKLDDLDEADFSDDAFDDPLGIAVPWEEKYGKGKEEGSAAEPAKETAGGNEED